MWCVLPHIFVEPVCLSFWVSFSVFMMHICNCRLFLQIVEIIFYCKGMHVIELS